MNILCLALAYLVVFAIRAVTTYYFVRWIVKREVAKLDAACAASFAEVSEDMDVVLGRVKVLSEQPLVRFIQSGGNA